MPCAAHLRVLIGALPLLFGCRTRDTPGISACMDGEVADGGRCVPEDCGQGVWGDLQTGEDAV